jgi:hypothetical protein
VHVSSKPSTASELLSGNGICVAKARLGESIKNKLDMSHTLTKTSFFVFVFYISMFKHAL